MGRPGLLHDPLAEVLVGHEQQVLVLGRGVDDLDGVAAGADDVAERLHCRAAVDVGDGVEVGVGLLELGQLVRRAAFLQRAAGVFVRQDDDLVRAQYLGRLGHEMDAAEDDYVGLGLGRLLGEAQRIAHEVGDVLDFRHLVVVGENDRVKLLLEHKDLARERVELRARHRPAHRETVHAGRRNCRLTQSSVKT